MTDRVIPIVAQRSCGSCAECCKGWLSGVAYEQVFHPGKPCFFLQDTCGIYESRPEDPCKSYKCAWLSKDEFPLWMRPDKSKSIVTERTVDGIQYFDVVECGQKMDSETLSWLFIWALEKGANLQYRINGGPHKIGSQEFLDAET